MLTTFYDPGKRTESVVRHGHTWATSPLTRIPFLFGVQALRRNAYSVRNSFRQRGLHKYYKVPHAVLVLSL